MKTLLDYRLMEWGAYQRELKIISLRGALAWKKHLGQDGAAGVDRGGEIMTTEKWATLSTGIVRDLIRLERGLMDMKRACARLEEAGMYPAVPSESWEPRTNSTHGEARYLRLVFGKDRPRDYPRKVYVGADPDKIADARRKVANRCKWEELDGEITRLERFLQMTRGDLRRVAGSVERRQLPEGLVTEGDVAEEGSVTKEEWVLTGAPEVEYNHGQAEQVSTEPRPGR